MPRPFESEHVLTEKISEATLRAYLVGKTEEPMQTNLDAWLNKYV